MDVVKEEKLRVTERTLREYEKFCHIDTSNLPEGTVIVDSGSGAHQLFARELLRKNKKVKVVNFDLSLGLPIDKPYDLGIRESTQEERKLRRVNALLGSVAAKFPLVPIKKESIDFWVDCYGPGTYLSQSELSSYLSEANRTIKLGKEIHIYPIDSHAEYVGLKLTEAEKRLALGEARAYTATKDAKISLKNVHIYDQPDEEGNIRLGLIIKKL